jgi:glycosyltransferase involved in cell wall biosynthesis
MKTKITIFTPTYNRASLLVRCYNSLLEQSSRDFMWLIVDDGSMDDTRSLVERWRKEAKIKIDYIWQKNGGKHVAHNTAIEQCKTDYMLILDSDDTLDENCIEQLNLYIDKIDNRENVSGVIGNRFKLSDKTVIGTPMPRLSKYVSGNDLYQKYNFTGDTLRLYKTSILKKFPFPVVPGERFMSENIVFDQIDAKYKMLAIQDRLYYGDYLEDGYTTNASKIKLGNPVGYSMSLNSSVRYSKVITKKISWTLLYIMWGKKMNIQKRFINFTLKPFYILLYPFAMVLYIFRLPPFFFAVFDNSQVNETK